VSDIQATHDGTRLTITRSFAAPRQFVWDAYTIPEQIEKWWGPVGFQTTNKVMDVRPGGTWHYRMHSPEWGDSWAITTYREVSPIDRLVYTDAFTDETGVPNESMPQSTVTIAFSDAGDRTLVTIHTDYPTEDDVRKVLEMGVEQGIESQFTRLDELAAGRSA
jgi:uncharacterized protein YndB with AHSA1/START domain